MGQAVLAEIKEDDESQETGEGVLFWLSGEVLEARNRIIGLTGKAGQEQIWLRLESALSEYYESCKLLNRSFVYSISDVIYSAIDENVYFKEVDLS